MKHTTLKACPFCGGQADTESKYSRAKEQYYICVTCKECGAKSKTFTSQTDPAKGYTDAVMFATMLWNRRPEDPAANTTTEEVEKHD